MAQDNSYNELIQEESIIWGKAAHDQAQHTPPDWEHVRRLPHMRLLHGRHIEALLNMIQPGWRVLEVGCSSGWLSLEMARRGAHVEGMDIAEEAIAIGWAYAAQHPPSGSVNYAVRDINHTPLEPDKYDLVVCVGMLHHLAEVEAVLRQIRAALRTTGMLFVSDIRDTPKVNTLVAGALTMLLPTQLSYREKIGHLVRLRGNAVSHMRDSIEAKGLSPFEGYGRHMEPERLVGELFDVRWLKSESAFVGYIIAQLKLPPKWLLRIGGGLATIDRLLVRLRLLRGLNYVLLAVCPVVKT